MLKRCFVWENEMLVPFSDVCTILLVQQSVGNIKLKIHCKHFLNCDRNGTLESVKLRTLGEAPAMSVLLC